MENLLLGAWLALFLIGCTETDNYTVLLQPERRQEIETRIALLINNERMRRGLKPLDRNDQLYPAAESHCKDMAVQGYFDHTSKSGRTVYDRVNLSSPDYHRTIGECLYRYEISHQRYMTEDWEVGDKEADVVSGKTLAGWMGSRGHYKLIADQKRFRSMDVAVQRAVILKNGALRVLYMTCLIFSGNKAQ